MSPMNNRRMTPMAEPGVLDFAPGAAAAYSLRNLSLSYAGPVVTVRRSTDSAEADFTAGDVSDGTLAAWCSGGDGFVKQWWDQSGNARHATASGTAQPQIVDSGVLVTEGGKAAVRFDGSNDRLTVASFVVPQPMTAVAVARNVTVNPNGNYYFDGSGRASLIVLSSSISLFAGSTVASGFSTTSLQEVVFAVFDAASSYAALNGAKGSNVDPGVGGLTSLGLANNFGGNGLAYSEMNYQELIIYQSDMTALRTRIEGNLAWYY